ncbi:glycosyltransferase involved in cell wall biosynthesis [Oikeobacillus pervagus]|uniref:Glycosyltransferase involved in cell wall biosynthesis n=1 Tax=Oikeobacillus pervagus TaxID=1325931 RepID=A0AAJ1SXM0_9BACI|nr:glycosyltransferase [Oikeobacillus pervagus]MDQ0214454.1 glycosyltransferase involved in cell wall biosynthesis [Oikeobacillus pervagus]
MENTSPLISIIIPAKNEGDNVRTTLHSLYSTKSNYSFETIVINDGSTDNCCDFLRTDPKFQVNLIHTSGIGPANARNLGAKNALGDFLFFCDAHLEFEDWWIDHLLEPMITGKTDAITPAIGSINDANFIGYGQTLTSNLRTIWNGKQNECFETAVLPGGCFAIKKTTFFAVGGFETGFNKWGYEDVELSIKLWLFGHSCHVQPNVKILHRFRESHPYEAIYEDFYYNFLRTAFLHFSTSQIQKCKKLVVHGDPEKIEKQLLNTGITKQRESYFQKRKYTADWYFRKFKIHF